MSGQQAAKLKQIDAQCRAQHVQEMNNIDPASNPNVPAVVRFLDTNVYGGPLL